jgi:aspartyl-tRNA(Asn)/glutamyl-tRNA(Gln) amidotransferase subunit B
VAERWTGIPAGWEAVIGLEVHTQLRTRSKLFSPAPVAFGAEPNTRTSEIDLGLPGVLPVLNARAVELAVRLALALGCRVHEESVFARKHYFYPDLPKGYQISQYEQPFATGGAVPIELDGVEKGVPLARIHMEEDAGKLIHDDAVTGARVSHVDLNRAGVPLVEIVSEPALRTPAEAGAYLRSLRAIVRWLGVGDADMEKGQMRCDGNVSVRRAGDPKLGTKIELKNLNSVRFIEKALAYEIARQIEVLEGGGRLEQETRGWDERAERTRPQRSKETAADYRYFPDPDLGPLRLDPAQIERWRAALPELPLARARRFEKAFGLPGADARQLVEDRALADLLEETVRLGAAPKTAANWILRDVLEIAAGRPGGVGDTALRPAHLAELLELLAAGKLTAASARQVLAAVATSGAAPAEVMRARGLEAVSDAGELGAVLEQVLAANPEPLAKLRAGDARLGNFFVGQVMRATGGKADPAVVRRLLEARLRAP